MLFDDRMSNDEVEEMSAPAAVALVVVLVERAGGKAKVEEEIRVDDRWLVNATQVVVGW